MNNTRMAKNRLPKGRTGSLSVAALVLVVQLTSLFLLQGCGVKREFTGGEHWSRANLNSVLWGQTSEEYYSLAVSAYYQARNMLDKSLADKILTALPDQEPKDQREQMALMELPPAIILDVDDTVLNNLAYQAWLVKENRSYNPISWNRWIVDKEATALPGVVEFIHYAREKGVKVFYVTNREFEGDVDENGNGEIEPSEENKNLKKPTIENLRQLGLLPQEKLREDCLFPGKEDLLHDDSVFMKNEMLGWGSDKTIRRNLIATCHRVVLLVGDSLGDFIGYKVSGKKDSGEKYEDYYKAINNPNQRRKDLEKHKNLWGENWIVLPNPTYGNWERTLYDFKDRLSSNEKGQQKLEALDVWTY